MEYSLTVSAKTDLVNYISKNFPNSPLAFYGKGGELVDAFERGGHKVFVCPKQLPENVRAVVVAYADWWIGEVKPSGVPLVVVTKGAPIEAFTNKTIKDNQYLETGYLKHVFIDIKDGELVLQKHLLTLGLSIFTELVGVLGSGVRDARATVAFKTLQELKERLLNFCSNSELLNFLAEIIEKLGGVELVECFNYVSFARVGEDACSVRFYCAFSLLYLIRWFTNIDFCVILPYIDVVRLRELCKTRGVKQWRQPLDRDVRYELSLVKPFLLTQEELALLLSQFRITGEERVTLEEVISDFTVATELARQPNIFITLVSSGYLDATHQGRGEYET